MRLQDQLKASQHHQRKSESSAQPIINKKARFYELTPKSWTFNWG